MSGIRLKVISLIIYHFLLLLDPSDPSHYMYSQKIHFLDIKLLGKMTPSVTEDG